MPAELGVRHLERDMKTVKRKVEYLAVPLIVGVFSIILIHYFRDIPNLPFSVQLALGSAPSFIASVTLPAVLYVQKFRFPGLLSRVNSFHWHLISIVVTMTLLCAWEIEQINRPELVFDLNDLFATIFGAFIYLLSWPKIREISE